jgi:hypothetical protein
MAESFGDNDTSPGGMGKRPAPTIEGTATEIVAEPTPGRASPAGETPRAGEEPKANGGAACKEKLSAKADPAPPRTSMPELKSFATHLAAGLLGGLVGVLALAFAWNRLPGSGEAGAPPDLTAIEKRLGQIEATPKDNAALSALDLRIKGLEGRKSEASPELSELTERVGHLERALKALGETANAGGSVADGAAVNNRIAEAEQRLQARIDGRLAEGETADQKALGSAETEIADLKAKVATLSQSSPVNGDGEVAAALAGLDNRTAKLEAELSTLSGEIDKDQAGARSAASVLALGNLRAAVDAGRPYAAELVSIRRLAPEIRNFGALPAFADQGIPTLPELTASFATAEDTALAALPTPKDESFFGSLLASAKSMVKVRRIDAGATGDDPDAVLARAEAKLKQDELAEAVKEVDGLSGASREAFAPWIDAARARASADDTLSNIETALLERAGTTPPAQAPSR